MKKSIAILALLTMLAMGSVGCLGRGALGGSVGKFNLEVVENKWARWGVFLLLGPVYGFAGGIDLLIVNSIEFHTGKNPWSGQDRLARAGDVHLQEGPNGERVVSTLMADGSIDLAITEANGKEVSLNVMLKAGEYIARNAEGQIVAKVRDPRYEVRSKF